MRPKARHHDGTCRTALAVLAMAALAACPGAAAHRSAAWRGRDARRGRAAPRTRPAAEAPASSGVTLEGTEWRLVALGGEPVAAGDNRSAPGFRLVADGRKVQGNAGCNRMMGSYELDGGSLKFGPLASTKMACPAMETETKFLAALDATTRYELAGSNLTLFAGDAPVARLEATPAGR